MGALADALAAEPDPVDPRKGGKLDKLDPEDQAAIVAKADAGWSGEQLAEFLTRNGISLRGDAVRKWLRRQEKPGE